MKMVNTIEECRSHIGFRKLTKRGKTIYTHLCNQMLASGEFPVLYLDQISAYANLYDDYLTLDEKVKTEGYTLVSRDKRGDDRLYANPAVKMRDEALREVLRIGKNFGFSTLDRTRVPGAGMDDPFARFMKNFDESDDD